MAADEGYSGCIGVVFSGCQPASRSVASLPSWSPLRIAVIGRQKLYWNLASQSTMKQLARAMDISANTRALSATGRLCRAEACLAAWNHAGPRLACVQNRTVSDCASVRFVLFAPPISLVSL